MTTEIQQRRSFSNSCSINLILEFNSNFVVNESVLFYQRHRQTMRLSVPVLTRRSVIQVLSQPARRIPLILLLMAICAASTVAQTTSKQPLITQPVEDSKLTVLHGNSYPLARARNDRGAAPSSLPMERMMLVLKRAPEQET